MKKRMHGKVLSLVLTLAMLASLAFAGVTASAAEGDQYSFQILFTSDLHGCFYDWSYSTNGNYLGLARIATLVGDLRDENTILIDVGDTIQGNGTTIFTSDAWDGMYPLLAGMEYLEYDAWVLGNHEFNFGVPALEKAYGKGQGEDGGNLFTGAILAGNLFDENDDPVYDAYMIKEMPNGLRVAIVGMTNPNIEKWDVSNLAEAGYTTESATIVTAQTIKHIKDNDLADIIIAAEHLSETGEYEREGSGAEDVLADEYNAANIDLFIGAHGHLNVNKMINGVRFTEVAANGGRLGQATVTVTQQADGSWKVEDKEEDVAVESIVISQYSDNVAYAEGDADYKELLKEAHEFGVENCTTVIGELIGDPLVPDPALKSTYQAYLQDTALVHLINDAMLYYTNEYVGGDEFAEEYPEYAGMEVTLSGTAPLDTNANHHAGKITKGSASTIYKYDNNTLYVLAMTGGQFKAWMEWAYMFIGPFISNGVYEMGAAMVDGDLNIPYGNGNMAGYNMDQFEGVTYNVDLTQPVGSRIVDLKNKATGEDLDLEETFLVAVNNYRAGTHLTAPTGNAIYGDDPKPVILSKDIETKTPGTGEGMLGVMIDYIQNVLDGVVDNTDGKFFEPNWAYITPEVNEDLLAIAIEALEAGQIELFPVNGNAYARRAIKDSEVDWVLGYDDVFAKDWFFSAVGAVVNSGLMNGTAQGVFSPDVSVTIEMFITILHRIDGLSDEFDDAIAEEDAELWYAAAVAWGEGTGILDGLCVEPIGSNQKATRQDMMTMLYRYLVYLEVIEGVEPADISEYADGDEIADWASDAFAFAVGAKLVFGIDDEHLAPESLTTRAQVATMFVRITDYIDNYEPPAQEAVPDTGIAA